jgi:glycosyltransferase involved in cell wall biosynthesis
VGGTFIFVGAYFRVGHWFKAALPQRTILVYNTYQPDRFAKARARLQAWHRTPVEVVYTSPMLRRYSDIAGPVIESPIDLAHFSPAPERERPARTFTVGRMSRDVASKHHHEDPAVYATLAAMGMTVRVMGGSCLLESSPRMGADALLPAGARDPKAFLRHLDCFFYRTSDRWLEAYGRVVFEAMACGLPVVCGRRGGYADYVVHGVNGFLFDTSKQAIELIAKLRNDVALRERIGRAARHTVEELYRGRAWREKLAYFLPPQREPRATGLAAAALDPTPSELMY